MQRRSAPAFMLRCTETPRLEIRGRKLTLAQLDVQNRRPAPPLGIPLGRVEVHGLDVGEVLQRRERGLLDRLAGQKGGGGLGEDDADGNPVVGQGVNYLGQLDRGDGACGRKEEARLGVVGLRERCS